MREQEFGNEYSLEGVSQEEGDQGEAFINTEYFDKTGHKKRGEKAKEMRLLRKLDPWGMVYSSPIQPSIIQQQLDNRRSMLRSPRSGK